MRNKEKGDASMKTLPLFLLVFLHCTIIPAYKVIISEKQ